MEATHTHSEYLFNYYLTKLTFASGSKIIVAPKSSSIGLTPQCLSPFTENCSQAKVAAQKQAQTCFDARVVSGPQRRCCYLR